MIERRELGKTHVQFFKDGICLGTIRTEHADEVLAILERHHTDAISDNTKHQENISNQPST